jgi:hypothetical protein
MAQRYRVTGPHPVFGHAPGATFARDIPSGQEARLVASGALRRVGRAGSRPPRESAANGGPQRDAAPADPPDARPSDPAKNKE